MKRSYKTLFIILLILSSCTPQDLTQEELTNYIQDEENGLRKTSEVSGYSVEVLYRPTDMLVAQEAGNDVKNDTVVKALQNKYAAYHYFILNLSKDKKEALQVNENYSTLLQTLSFNMGQYVNLTTSSQDTIPTSDFILNRTFGFSNATSLLFVFDKEKTKGKEWIQFNLNEFGLGTGNQRFRFAVKDIENIPRLNLNLIENTND